MKALFQGLRPNRVTLVGAAAVLLLAGIALWALRAPAPDPRIEAIRKKGYPVTLAELDAWYPAVPASNNIALVYTKVFASPLFTHEPSPIDAFTDKNWLPARGQPLAPADKAELTALLATNAPLLRPLYSATGPSRYPIDLKQGFGAQLPHLAKCKMAVNLLTAAALLHAGDGEAERAMDDLAAAGRISDSLSEEPLLISQLVRMACWNLVLSRLERVVNLTSLTEAQLTRLQKLVEGAESSQSMARALAGELASGLAVYAEPKTWVAVNLGNTTLGERIRGVVLVDGLKVSGFFAKDKAFYLNVMTTNLAVAELPLPDRLKASQQAAGLTPPGRFYLLSAMLLPGLSRAFLRDAAFCAGARVVQTGLAVERFRLVHTNALPVSLQDLLPAYLKSVPADPYDGNPLRFKPRKAGYVVYSIGEDGKDDGGLERLPKTPNFPHDITFIVEH